jgi:hypothetical protein
VADHRHAQDVSESNQTLWLLAASPTVWVLHFLACWFAVSMWCAKVAGPTGPLGPVRPVVAGLTLGALAAIAVIGWVGLRRHRFGVATVPHDFDTPEDRHRFLGFAAVLLSGLSAVAVVYVALAAVFLSTCR